MRSSTWLCALLLGAAATGHAQQRDTVARRDSTRTPAADSAARADSAFLADAMRAGAAARRDTTPARPTGTVGATNPRLLPDISAVGDMVGDLSPKGSTQEDGTRFGIREVEVAVQAAVDPYFRGDIFLGFNDVEGVGVEQAFLTATALPHGLEVRLGRFLMPVGKQNTTHRHDLHTVEFPYVVQRFFGGEALKGTGVWVSRIFAPLGFYQELQVTAIDRFGEAPDGLTTATPVNKRLADIGYSARLRNYWDVTQNANFELSASAVTGKREQPIGCQSIEGDAFCPPTPLGYDAVGARQTVAGVDLTYRWRPLQRGLYRSFIFQAEAMRQFNAEVTPASLPGGFTYLGPTRDFTGAYAFARNQLTRRAYLGARYDYLQDEENAGRTLHAGSGYLEWFPSEFSKLMAAYERVQRDGIGGTNRILLQATFALGPHRPHPF